MNATVIVVHVIKDQDLPAGQLKIEFNQKKNIADFIGYYNIIPSRFPFIAKIRAGWKYITAHRKILRLIKEKYGRPYIVHIQIAWSAGLIGLWLKFFFGWKYVLSEHWSGYSRDMAENVFLYPSIKKSLVKLILRNASVCMPVSDDLGRLMQAFESKTRYKPVSNVVDTRYFFPNPEMKFSKFRFIHASMMGPEKNVPAIIRAIYSLSKKRNDFELYLVGPENEDLINYCKELAIYNIVVFFTGLKDYAGVSLEMQKSQALISFSIYETQSCVILESLCCGIPVIAAAVGGITELITTENGILVDKGDEDQLLKATDKMINEFARFERLKIAEAARERFSYETIGKEFIKLYDQVIK